MIPTPSELVGVVGPNGCGKSNIIDAVRWVLGETRASELRGASMQDVIFNGSELRKPSARASVELVFDNSLGRALGQWSAFAEISVRRVLTRDGASSYYINQQGVRRRDVHDLFLGTGLGSRGYAIIGQGMIHRLIEARPEELRVTLEEAAGVSRYKERRRETENRLADTRENLQRLEDILGELAGGLEKLQRQARVADRFRSLQAERQLKQNLFWWLGEQAAEAQRARLAVECGQAQAALESDQSRLRTLETQLDVLRQTHFEAGEALHGAQGQLFEAGARVSSHEAEVRHMAETRTRLQARQNRLQGKLSEWQGQQRSGQQRLAELEAGLQAAQTQAADSAAALRQVQQGLPELEAQVRTHAQAFAAAGRSVVRLEQALALAGQAQRQAQTLYDQAQARQQHLLAEQQAHAPVDETRLSELAQACASAEADRQAVQQRLDALEAHDKGLTAQRDRARRDAQAARHALERLDARLQALGSLQQIPVGEAQAAWLDRYGLQDRPPLWQRLQVAPGWEVAFEAVLAERLQAIEVADLDAAGDALQDGPAAGLTLYQGAPPPEGEAPASIPGLVRLLDHVHISDPALHAVLHAWLASVWTAPDLAQAMARRGQLAPGCCCVVPEGHCVYPHSVQVHAADPLQDGRLARQHEIEQLHGAVAAARSQAEQAEDHSQQLEQACRDSEQTLSDCREQLAACTQVWHELRLRHTQRRDEQAHAQVMAARTQADLRGIESLLIEQRERQAEAEAQQAGLQAEHAQARAQLETLEAQRDQLAEALEARHQDVRVHERATQEAEWAVRAARQLLEEQHRNARWAEEQSAQS
ncbi:chromosome segregation protein SMC, partial [Castellaniella sp.]|uniref:chromosome segregation protein SMC n=1 Tax=Castellaniella sp. TaxID=1955812 RepID=UPI003565F994